MRGVLSGSRKHPAAFPGDAAELTEDILRIAEAVVGSGEAEELERSFTEVHEYLRVAAQLVFEELDRARPPPPHR